MEFIPYIPDLNDVSVNIPPQELENEISVSFSAKFQSSNSSSYFAYELLVADKDTPDEVVPIQNNVKGGQSILLPIIGEVADGSTTIIKDLNTTNSQGESADINDVSIRIVAVSPQYHAFLMEESKLTVDTHYSSSYYVQDGIFSNFTSNAYGIFGGFNERTVKLLE